jgi:hypothetical protein
MTDGMTVTSLSASLQHKTRVAMDHVCQITLNLKVITYHRWQKRLSHKFEKWCKFSSRIKTKLHKKKLRKTRPACIM